MTEEKDNVPSQEQEPAVVPEKREAIELDMTKAYALQSELPFRLTIEEREGKGFLWDLKYQTSLAGQVAVFGYMCDLLDNVIANQRKRFAQQEAKLQKLSPAARKNAKRQFTHTKINNIINYRNFSLEMMNEMLPLIYEEAKKNNAIKIVSEQEAQVEIEKMRKPELKIVKH